MRALLAAIVITAAVAGTLAVAAPVVGAAPSEGPPTVRETRAQVFAAGGTVSGCSGTAVSKDENGQTIDTVSGPGGPPASRDNALKVDYDGVVSYDGQTDNLIKNHSWHISIFGIKVKSDSDTNEEERISDASDEVVSDYIPFRMSGKYYVTFEISGEGGSCSGSLWVEIDENPIGTIPWLVGTGLMLAGVAGLAFSFPSGGGGGIAAGTGAAASAGEPAGTVIGDDSGTAPAPTSDDGPVIGDAGGEPRTTDSGDEPVIGG